MGGDEPIASKWNARYAFANKTLPEPAAVFQYANEFLPSNGVALDVACGRAGNAFHLASLGFDVYAWDISDTVIDWVNQHNKQRSEPLKVFAEVRDVVLHPPEPESFDVIAVSRFLDRSICDALMAALKPDGILLYETFTAGLNNKNYSLEASEITQLFSELNVLFHKETEVDANGMASAMLIAQRKTDRKSDRKSEHKSKRERDA